MITPAKFLGLLALCATLSTTVFSSQAADAPQRDARSIINSMRLKNLNKSLELTADQQKQVQALFDEEAKEIGKLPETPSLVERSNKSKNCSKSLMAR